MKFSIVFLFTLFLFASCAKLPLSKSKKYTSTATNQFDDIATNYYDKTNSVLYGIADDQTHFYLKAVFNDQESMKKIMRGGLRLYFDSDGKKHKNYQLKIERSEKPQRDRNTMPTMDKSRENHIQNMPVLIEKSFNKITWDKNGKEYIFYRALEKDPICVELGPNQQNQLVLVVKIPLKELPIPESKLFAMGIETGSVTTDANRGAGGSMRPSGGMGRGGGRSGGGGGHGGGMGSGGGRPGGGVPGGGSSSTSPLKIWFQVELSN